MTYPQCDNEYRLDPYYFQPPISGTCSGTTGTHYVAQGDFYYNWIPNSVYHLPVDNQHLPSGSPFKPYDTTRWLPEPPEANTMTYFSNGNRYEVANTNSAKSYACPNCHKQYCRKSTLKAHLRQHLNDRPFVCQVCGKSFSQAANLTAHRRVHTGEKPFSCPICLRPFSQSSSLVTHKRTHTGERPYPCMHCEKAFTDSSTLTKHLRTHTGQKPYQCHLCMMRFTQSGNLHRHMKTHRNQQ